MAELTLYYRPTCPFCSKVYEFLKSKNIDIPLKNILESTEYQEELISIGGKSQGPCLIIDGKALYESDDIIKWFENAYAS